MTRLSQGIPKPLIPFFHSAHAYTLAWSIFAKCICGMHLPINSSPRPSAHTRRVPSPSVLSHHRHQTAFTKTLILLLALTLTLTLTPSATAALQPQEHSYPDINDQHLARRTLVASSTLKQTHLLEQPRRFNHYS